MIAGRAIDRYCDPLTRRRGKRRAAKVERACARQHVVRLRATESVFGRAHRSSDRIWLADPSEILDTDMPSARRGFAGWYS